MVAIVKNNLRISSCQSFLQLVKESADNDESYYITLGRTRSWDDDTKPDYPVDSYDEFIKTYDELLIGKRIESEYAALAIPRNDWESGVVYDEYRHNYDEDNTTYSGASSLDDANFYVVNSELNVYKCIDNNNDSESEVEPTGTSTEIIELSDGYRWKFMYGPTSIEAIRFVTPDFIIVKTANGDDDESGQKEVEDEAIDGGIHHVVIKDGGSGYVVGDPVYIKGTGSDPTAEVDEVDDDGAIQKISITDPGSENYKAYFDRVDSSDGENADIEPILSPFGGHGSDAIHELNGRFLILNGVFSGEEDDEAFVNNDFRTITILRNPVSNDSDEVLMDNIINFMKRINVDDISGDMFTRNNTIKGETSDATGKIVNYREETDGTYTIYYTQTPEDAFTNFEEDENIVEDETGTTATIQNVEDPPVKRYSGYMLYQENRRPIIRASDQTEDIKVIIEW